MALCTSMKRQSPKTPPPPDRADLNDAEVGCVASPQAAGALAQALSTLAAPSEEPPVESDLTIVSDEMLEAATKPS